MGVLDQVTQMKNKGLSEREIIDNLREQGVSPKAITDAMDQAKIKDAVSKPDLEQGEAPSELVGETQAIRNNAGAQDTSKVPNDEFYIPESGPNNKKIQPLTQEYQAPSNSNYAQPQPPLQQYNNIPQQQTPYPQYNDSSQPQENYPPQPYNQNEEYYEPNPQEDYGQEYAEPGYNQEYYPQEGYENYDSGGSETDTIIEISEQIFSEKIKKIKKEVEDLKEFKTLAETKLNNSMTRLKRIEDSIDKLQMAILEKVGSYGRGLDSVKKEMAMMQDSFSKTLPLLAKQHTTKKTTVKKTPSKRKK